MSSSSLKTLKSSLGSPFDRSLSNSYLSSVVIMTLSCIVTEIKRYIGRIAIFHTYFLTHGVNSCECLRALFHFCNRGPRWCKYILKRVFCLCTDTRVTYRKVISIADSYNVTLAINRTGPTWADLIISFWPEMHAITGFCLQIKILCWEFYC